MVVTLDMSGVKKRVDFAISQRLILYLSNRIDSFISFLSKCLDKNSIKLSNRLNKDG